MPMRTTMKNDRWILEGSIAIAGVIASGPISILRGSAQTWFSTTGGTGRRHLSLSCVDRRMLLGEAGGPGGDAHRVEPAGRPSVGYHEEVLGHPADNERVVRMIPRVDTELHYSATGLALQVRAHTLPGELSRDDNFRADQSPWSIHIRLVVPRAQVCELFALSEADAAMIERRFEAVA